jgi:Cu/Ag efflux protein CusF
MVSGQHKGVGVIVSVNSAPPAVEINHEEIKDFMPAMQMHFPVADASLLQSIVPGDKVEFVVSVDSGIEVVTEIRKR